MAESLVIAVSGINSLPDVEEMSADILDAARKAVNAATDRARTWSSQEMREQVNFPARYLTGSNGRLRVVKRAKGKNLESVLQGRFEPTSLARFAKGGVKKRNGQRGVEVEVDPGMARFLPRAFLMRLQAGDPSVRNLANQGLAIRVPKGQKPHRAYKPRKIDDGLWLLYGPSVDQVFRDVAADIEPRVSEYLNREFTRLMELKNG